MKQIFTIGFTKKTAEDFFNILKMKKVERILDVRLNNSSQLAGFAKKDDLIYFLKKICECDYRHEILLAPSKEILDGYKKKEFGWEEYEKQFNKLLETRNAYDLVNSAKLPGTCLLCSEPTPERCHRRLVAEYIIEHFSNIRISHL